MLNIKGYSLFFMILQNMKYAQKVIRIEQYIYDANKY